MCSAVAYQWYFLFCSMSSQQCLLRIKTDKFFLSKCYMSELHKTQCTVLLKAFHQCFHLLKLWATHHHNTALSLYFPNESGASIAALTCLCSAACLQCEWTEIAAFHYMTGQTCKKIKCKLKWSQTTFRLTCQQELEISFFWPLVVKVLILLQEKCAEDVDVVTEPSCWAPEEVKVQQMFRLALKEGFTFFQVSQNRAHTIMCTLRVIRWSNLSSEMKGVKVRPKLK